MLIDDKLVMFDDDSAACSASGTVLSTGISVGDYDISPGTEVKVEFLVATDFAASSASATVSFSLIKADDEDLTSNVEVLYTTPDFLIGTLVAGYDIPGFRSVPSEVEGYVGLRMNCGAIAISSGALFGCLTIDLDQH